MQYGAISIFLKDYERFSLNVPTAVQGTEGTGFGNIESFSSVSVWKSIFYCSTYVSTNAYRTVRFFLSRLYFLSPLSGLHLSLLVYFYFLEMWIRIRRYTFCSRIIIRDANLKLITELKSYKKLPKKFEYHCNIAFQGKKHPTFKRHFQ